MDAIRHRALLAALADVAVIAATPEGRVADWSAGAERLLGWTAAEMQGQPMERVLPPADAPRLAEDRRRAAATGRLVGERWCMRADGQRVQAQTELMPLHAAGALAGFLFILRDRTMQRGAEDALRDAQAMNDLVLQSSRDCIVVLDLEGHTRFVSPGGIESMEISDVEAIIGLSWLRVWKGAEHEAACHAVAEARAGRTGHFQGFCPTHKGTPKWWDVVISPMPGADGAPWRLISVGRDVTGTVQALARLELSEARLRLAVEAAEVGTWDLDIPADVLTWSDRTKAMFGIPPDAPVGMDDFYAGLHPDDLAATSEAFATALDPSRRATYDVEYRTIGKTDGVVRWIAAKGRGIFDAEGICVRAIGTAIDITARRAVEERLRRSEAELRELNATLEARVEERTRERDRLWSVSEDLLVVADYEGRLLRVSPSWTSLLGHSEATLLSRPYVEIIHPEDLPRLQEALRGVRVTGRAARWENRLQASDQSWRWIAWTLSPEPGGERVSGVGRDITEAKQREAQLEIAQEQLRQSQKMEAVGQLTGGLAHDFNNLLTGITGSLELLQNRIAQGRFGEVERFVTTAQGAARRAAALTHRLLAFSRRQTLDPKPFNVNRLVSGLEELIRRTVGPAITVEVVGAAGLWITKVDPHQLENALLNLAINARDAMPGGGRLTIETANTWLDGRAGRERDLPPGQYVSVCVTDTGTGMTPEVIQRAFDPFFTTKPIGLGTGLGLSMVYGFARQSGGQVRIYSELGQGTTMCLYLPRHHGPEGIEPEPATPARLERAAQERTVLVVDDEPTVRMLVLEVLEDLGYQSLEAEDGAAGLAILQSDARIDLLITDVGLPGSLNGRQVADAGRSLRPGLQVLFITGYAENAAVGNGHLEPGMHVLTKPFGMEALALRIKDLVP